MALVKAPISASTTLTQVTSIPSNCIDNDADCLSHSRRHLRMNFNLFWIERVIDWQDSGDTTLSSLGTTADDDPLSPSQLFPPPPPYGHPKSLGATHKPTGRVVYNPDVSSPNGSVFPV
jgi:hypothetical protein